MSRSELDPTSDTAVNSWAPLPATLPYTVTRTITEEPHEQVGAGSHKRHSGEQLGSATRHLTLNGHTYIVVQLQRNRMSRSELDPTSDTAVNCWAPLPVTLP
jgi:hypothetical protein